MVMMTGGRILSVLPNTNDIPSISCTVRVATCKPTVTARGSAAPTPKPDGDVLATCTTATTRGLNHG